MFGADSVAGKYSNVELDETAIQRGDYKRYLGGGSESWDSRGLFQLNLLQSRGLKPSSTLLDIGCGPLRAGLHFIRYLAAGNYCGFDYNKSFISVCQRVIEENDLAGKLPTVLTLTGFDMTTIGREFDYAIAFSVLNHCNEAQRKLFLMNIGRRLAPGGKLFISHARWLMEDDIARAGLQVRHRFEAAEFDLSKYGWPSSEQRTVCPIYELGQK
jgi:SAM-dependent methyltransferase